MLCETMGAKGKERARALFAKEKTATQLRAHLLAHGRVRFDVGLLGRVPVLAFAYLAQAGRRIGGVFHRRRPSRFALAERKAREARKG